jgi:hypothetical protein
MKNHISLSINLYWIKIWSDMEIKSESWSYDVKYSTLQHLKSQCQNKIKSGNLHEVKKKWSDNVQYWCKLKLKKFLYFLSIETPYY